jgi:hypothetical protein
MRSKIGAPPLLLVGFLLASCASPRGLDEPPLQIPALKPGYGRVYFTRPGDIGGSAVQPEIRMNNEVVARSVPGGFSYVDRPPGKYAVTTATEIENAVTFQLAAGETKYIKTSVTPGILVGHSLHGTSCKASQNVGFLAHSGSHMLVAGFQLLTHNGIHFE